MKNISSVGCDALCINVFGLKVLYESLKPVARLRKVRYFYQYAMNTDVATVRKLITDKLEKIRIKNLQFRLRE